MYGDLEARRRSPRKTVGFSWSDPAIGALTADRVCHRGHPGLRLFPRHRGVDPQPGCVRAEGRECDVSHRRQYRAVAREQLWLIVRDDLERLWLGRWLRRHRRLSGNSRKNALQADPTAAGESGSVAVSKAYVGDIDGKYWRFTFTPTGTSPPTRWSIPAQPIFASSALLFVGTTDVYMFFATGSDLFPARARRNRYVQVVWLEGQHARRWRDDEVCVDLTKVTNSGGLATGERPSTSPSVAGDIVFYTTTTETASTPCADFSANLYAMTYAGGAAYDANNNGKIDNNESPSRRHLPDVRRRRSSSISICTTGTSG